MRSIRESIAFWRKLIVWTIKFPAHSLSQRLHIFLDYLRLYRTKRLTTEEYYEFNFEKKDSDYRNSFLGSVEQGLYLLKLNPVRYYSLARNKYLAHLALEASGIPMPVLLGHYNPLEKDCNQKFYGLLNKLKADGQLPFVIKATESSHGEGVYVVTDIIDDNGATMFVLIDGMTIPVHAILSRKEELIVESLIKQSQQMESFNKTSVNTIRFMTTLYPDGEARIIATILKIGRSGAYVDNAGKGGNVDTCIDVETGAIYNATQFLGFRNMCSIDSHPDSGAKLNGTIIKDWESIKQQIINFQQKYPFVKAAGWDVAITENGPVVIEVNDSWDRTFQLFLNKGWRNEIRDCYLAWKECGYDPKVERASNRLTLKQIKDYEKMFLLR